ncbi:hypothetical protein GCM10011332_13990 [Terasakiella brassicae]|uniref:Uncharacterized protein n=1 Tax=Terasakiella brassicae TaxID=1634917 RepID=A0A917FB91_9PROT|nr:hypothetical protein [Terasakiella brassicae]GGF61423.1 hypothetical protein GCM10011332_13990 [Terasakiella brassicae]
MNCPICQSAITPTGDTFSQKYDCPCCGHFTVFSPYFHHLTDDDRRKISGWIKKENQQQRHPDFKRGDTQLENILKLPIPGLRQRADEILLEALNDVTALDVKIDAIDKRYIAASYSLDNREVRRLCDFLVKQGLLEKESEQHYTVSDAGHIRYDELKKSNIQLSNKAFVAMWFDTNMNDIFENGLAAAIEQAGYEPIRIDRVDHIDKIDDQIITHIQASKFIVADFTGHRGGVYFEAGYALGRDIPVFWTCRKNHLDDLHFDIRQYNCIMWEEVEELKEKLYYRIKAVLGHGQN